MLEESGKQFEKISLYGYASAALHVAALLERKQQGNELNESASAFWQSQDVVNPTAFMRMYLPGK